MTAAGVLMRHYGHWATAETNDRTLTPMWLIARAIQARLQLNEAELAEAMLQAFVEQHREDEDLIAVGKALERGESKLRGCPE